MEVCFIDEMDNMKIKITNQCSQNPLTLCQNRFNGIEISEITHIELKKKNVMLATCTTIYEGLFSESINNFQCSLQTLTPLKHVQWFTGYMKMSVYILT
jgi:hypothetical protein